MDKYGCLTYTDPLNVFLNPNLTSYHTNIIHVIPGDIYKYSGHGDGQAYSVFWFNKNMQELSYEQYVTRNDTYVTITTPSNAAYAVFQSYGIELKLTNITRSITSIYETTNNIDKKINDVNMRFINHINQLRKRSNIRIFNNIDLTNDEYPYSWDRVVCDRIPITTKGIIHIVIKPKGDTIYIQHIRRRVEDYSIVDVIKTENFSVKDGEIIDLTCNFNINGDGQDFISVSGCYFKTSDVNIGYKQLSVNFDETKTSYSGFGGSNDNSGDMAYFIYVEMLKPLSGLVGVCLGDSITEFGNYPDIMSNITGCSFINCGIGGTRMSYRSNDSYSKWSFINIAKAISENDIYNSLMSDTSQLNNSKIKNLWKLFRLDFSKIDFITISYGTNDWAAGSVNIDSEENLEDTTTICGALRAGIKYLLSAYPHLKIYVFSPMYRNRTNGGDNLNSDDNSNSKGIFLYDIASSIVNTANNDLHIHAINCYNESGVNKLTCNYYLVDGLHCTSDGYELLGKQYAAFILSKYMI